MKGNYCGTVWWASAKSLTYRYMSDEERTLWEPYFIPFPPQGHIPTQDLDIKSVMWYKGRAITAHKPQYPTDGQKYLQMMRVMKPEERYRVIHK